MESASHLLLRAFPSVAGVALAMTALLFTCRVRHSGLVTVYPSCILMHYACLGTPLAHSRIHPRSLNVTCTRVHLESQNTLSLPFPAFHATALQPCLPAFVSSLRLSALVSNDGNTCLSALWLLPVPFSLLASLHFQHAHTAACCFQHYLVSLASSCHCGIAHGAT